MPRMGTRDEVWGPAPKRAPKTTTVLNPLEQEAAAVFNGYAPEKPIHPTPVSEWGWFLLGFRAARGERVEIVCLKDEPINPAFKGGVIIPSKDDIVTTH